MGMHKLIQTPELMWEMFQDYKVECKSDPIIVVDYVGKDATPVNRAKEVPLTLEGFEEYVATLPNMPWDLDEYFANKEGRYKEFTSVCLRIRKAIRNDQIRGGMAGIYNPSITQRLNGLVDKTETKVIKEQPLFSEDPTNEENGQ